MESAREVLGGLKMQIIEQLYEDLRHAHRIIDDLLCLTGRPGICFSCARPIMRIEPADNSGNALHFHLYNYNGEPHHCPDQEAK